VLGGRDKELSISCGPSTSVGNDLLALGHLQSGRLSGEGGQWVYPLQCRLVVCILQLVVVLWSCYHVPAVKHREVQVQMADMVIMLLVSTGSFSVMSM